jgi:hypothetical protein
MLQLIKQIWITKDAASALLLAAIVGVALWIGALPVSSSVQDAYLKRFHLATPSFIGWSAQQIVPAMYNLENRYWFSRDRLTVKETFENTNHRAFSSRNFDGPETGMVNHFPTRKFTFGDARSILNNDPNGYFYLSSKYRGREIRSSFQMRPVSDLEIQYKQLEWTIE